MSRYVALLRAINVGGHTVAMRDLRLAFEAFGFTDVATVIASGNVLFNTTARDRDRLERRIADALETEFGFPVATFLRTPDELVAVLRDVPFDLADGDGLYIGFLSRALTAAEARAVQQFATEGDEFAVRGRHLYWRRDGRMSDSKFTNARFERALKIEATFRNVTTVRKLAGSE